MAVGSYDPIEQIKTVGGSSIKISFGDFFFNCRHWNTLSLFRYTVLLPSKRSVILYYFFQLKWIVFWEFFGISMTPER